MIKKKDGFTSIELMVAIAILFIVITFVYSAYFFTLKISKVWNEKWNCENTAMICMKSLTEDIVHASAILTMRENELAMLDDNGKKIVYRVENGDLCRNGFCINPPDVKIYDLSFSFLKSSKIHEQSRIIKIELTVGSLRKYFTIHSAVSPRNIEKSFL